MHCPPPNLGQSSSQPGWDTSYSWGWTRPGTPMDRSVWTPWYAKFSARWPIPLFVCCPDASLRASPIKVLEPRTRRYPSARSSSTLLHWNRWSEDGTILTPGAGIIRPLDIIGTTSGEESGRLFNGRCCREIVLRAAEHQIEMSEKIAVFTPNPGPWLLCATRRDGNNWRGFQILKYCLPKTAVPSYALFTGIET